MIYAIGDLHFDSTEEKPMDIFGDKWKNHQDRIINNWKEIITDDDLVLIPGDISWALKLKEAKIDLEIIDKLPGKKVISKGNHDYWWVSLNKLNNLQLDSIFFMQNNSYIFKKTAIAGTRGWISKDSDGFSEKDLKVYKRELHRLELSLGSMEETIEKRIVILHYPPFNMDLKANDFHDIMLEYKVDICLYGHLHSDGHKFAKEGIIDGINYHCVSSDYIDFKPKLIEI